MIIPTPEFDPLFAQDGVPFREKMNAYIAREFADLLGPLGTATMQSPQRGKPGANRPGHRPLSPLPVHNDQRRRDAA